MKSGQIKHLPEYRGSLDPDAVAEGMNAANRNARRLVADAKLLLGAERYPSAAALAALAIEESGKHSILRCLAVAKTPEELRRQWRRYRDHRSKNGAWVRPSRAAAGARVEWFDDDSGYEVEIFTGPDAR